VTLLTAQLKAWGHTVFSVHELHSVLAYATTRFCKGVFYAVLLTVILNNMTPPPGL
jgi:hypothetical protein